MSGYTFSTVFFRFLKDVFFFQCMPKHQTENQETIRTSADQLIADVRKRLPQCEVGEVINTDQSGTQLELHSTRTVSHKGEEVSVGSIRSHLFKTSYVVITCSSSEKLTTSLVECWGDHVLLPSLGKRKKFLLISGCWGGQTDGKGLYDHIPACTRLEIPKKTTHQIQPLNVFFNRQMRVTPRVLYDRVLLDELNISISERNHIIRLMSLTHNQLSSEVFRAMIKCAWYARGYTDTSKLWPKCVFLSTQQYAPHPHAMRILFSAAAGVTSHHVSITFS